MTWLDRLDAWLYEHRIAPGLLVMGGWLGLVVGCGIAWGFGVATAVGIVYLVAVCLFSALTE